jgi:predicted transcriptional regulator
MFSSNIRIKIMILLNSQPLSLSELAKEIGEVSKSEISRHLARLNEQGLIEKDALTVRNHKLTSFGEAITTLIAPLNFINTYGSYFKDHSLKDLSPGLLKNIEELNEAILVNGTGRVVSEIKNLFETTKNEIWAMYSTGFPFENSKIHKGKFILNTDYYLSDVVTRKNTLVLKNLRWENISFRLLPRITVGMAIFDRNEAAIITFPRIDLSADINSIFIIKDSIGIMYAQRLWNYFWNLGKPPVT